MLSLQVDLLDDLIEFSDQSLSQLHLIDEAPDVVMISCEHHDSFNSFLSVAWEMVVLRLLHLFLRFRSQQHQSFSWSISHASLERPPWCGSLDHVTDAANTIGHWPLIDDHPHKPKYEFP
jgi:hypothetical protein